MEDIDEKKVEASNDAKNANGILKYSDEIISIAKELVNRKDNDLEKSNEIDEKLRDLNIRMKKDCIDLESDMKIRAKNGDFEQQFHLAIHYYTMQKYEESKKWLLTSAENGYPEAMLYLAYAYNSSDDKIFEQDKEKAIEWFEKSSKSDDKKIAECALEELKNLKEEV